MVIDTDHILAVLSSEDVSKVEGSLSVMPFLAEVACVVLKSKVLHCGLALSWHSAANRLFRTNKEEIGEEKP